MTPPRPSVFIENIFPVNLLNLQVYFENGGNPFKGLHRWYSRKPLSFSRASVLGSLLPAEVTIEEFEYLLGLDRARQNESDLERDDRYQKTRLYKTPPSPERVKRVQELCEQVWGDKTPAVLDAFAGGGSIPFEAARYGLRVFASDLNPVAVVTMKAAIEFPLMFGAELQQDIDKWVQWVGQQAEERLGEFFPAQEGNPPQPPLGRGEQEDDLQVPLVKGDLGGYKPTHGSKNPPQPPLGRGEQEDDLQVPLVKGDLGGYKPMLPQEENTESPLAPLNEGGNIKIQNYLWAHTVQCPSCQSTVPLSPNWWIDRSPGAIKKGEICAVKPVPNPAEKRVDFELVKGKKGKGNTIQTPDGDFDPNNFSTMSRGVGKCPNCDAIIEDSVIKKQAQAEGLGHQLYAVAFKQGKGSLEFRVSNDVDLQGFELAEKKLQELENSKNSYLIPDIQIPYSNRVYERDCVDQLGLTNWKVFFNPRQLLTLVTYVEIINEAKEKIRAELGEERAGAIVTYLALVLDRCVDHNCRLGHWQNNRGYVAAGSTTHALNLMWNYPETSAKRLWDWQVGAVTKDYSKLCELLATKINSSSLNLETHIEKPVASKNEALIAQIQAMAAARNLPYDPRFLPYNHKLTDRAKELRKNMTAAEKKLWHEFLKTFSDRVWRQRPIDHFIVDFYCPKRHLVIEVDGDSHFTEEGQASDAERTQILEAYGLQVLRFTNEEVLQNFEGVCAAIEALNPPQPPFERGEQEQSPQVPLGRGEQEQFLQVPLEKGDLGGYKPTHDSKNPPQPPLGRGEQGEVPLGKGDLGGFQITHASADSLYHLADQSIDAVVTDPPYYSTIQYAELSDFFYVWQKRILGDIFPELYYSELTDKDREAVANPSRFRDMGASPKDLADQDYEAKMQMAFSEYYRVLKDNGVMTVQFNHKDSGAWDVLAQSLITAGFEITASWAVSTENPQNLHQAQKNSVSSTVLLVCRKRDPNTGTAWWDDIRPELSNLVEQRAPEFEANDITGIDLYLSSFGPALNVFSRAWPVLDSSGEEMRPEVAFEEARKAISNYRLHKLLNQDTSGFDALTQWYILAWDTFQAREFPYDDARQLALAVGGFDLNADLKNTHKLIEAKSGTCTLLTPQKRLKKRAFSISPMDFTFTSAIDALHAVIAIYQEEETIEPVRQFVKKTELLTNEQFMKAWEVALKAIPHIGDEKKRIPEERVLADLWLAMDEIQAKVVYDQRSLALEGGQMDLFST